MGRGRGGYTGYETSYKDSGGKKVTDKGSIFVAERYIDQGYESVFRREHQPEKSYDLTIKSSDDSTFIKNIEVKRVTSESPASLAKNIKKGFSQFKPGYEDTVAIVLPNHCNDEAGRKLAQEGFAEAKRKGWVKGKVEVWFNDKTKIDLE